MDSIRATMRIEEVAALLGLSRAATYEAIRRGEIPSVRIGKRVLVPSVAVERLLACPSGENAHNP